MDTDKNNKNDSNNHMYYYVILNKDSSYIGYFIYLSNLRNKETNKFFDNSRLISIDLNYESGHKMLFALMMKKYIMRKILNILINSEICAMVVLKVLIILVVI